MTAPAPLVDDRLTDPTTSSREGREFPPHSLDRHRVLAWSGPTGWRNRRPILIARGVSATSGADEGFSLVELMVALLVMAILLAIAIPTFLGTTGAADDRSAQSNLATAFVDAKAQFQSAGQTYDVQGAADAVKLADALNGNQLQLAFKAGNLGNSTSQGSSGSAGDISVAVSSDGVGAVLAAFSVPGNCFYLVDNTGTLSTAAVASTPYAYGSGKSVTSGIQTMSGPIGLPTARGTSYVTGTGDADKSDCNAFRPMATGPGITARFQSAGFPSIASA